MSEERRPSGVESSWSIFFDLTAKAAAGGGVLAFILSVVYDFAYIDAIGLSFRSVPTTIADHVRTGLIWLPPTVLAIAAGLAIEVVLGRIEGGRTEEEIQASSSRLMAWFRRSSDRIPLVIAALVVLSFVVWGGTPLGFYFTAAAAWWLLGRWVLRHRQIRERFTRVGTMMFLFAPILVFLVAAKGAANARHDFYGGGPSALFATDTAAGRSVVRAKPIRYFERNVLVVDDQLQLRILRVDSMISVTGLPRPYVYEGLLCANLGGVACDVNAAVISSQHFP